MAKNYRMGLTFEEDEPLSDHVKRLSKALFPKRPFSSSCILSPYGKAFTARVFTRLASSICFKHLKLAGSSVKGAKALSAELLHRRVGSGILLLL